VGKGKGDRAFVDHGRIHPPSDTRLILIFPQDSEADAFESERELIWLFGRKDLGTGILRNLTDGGEGGAGCHAKKAPRTLEHLQKMRKVNLGHPDRSTPEGKAKADATKRTPEMRALAREHARRGWELRRKRADHVESWQNQCEYDHHASSDGRLSKDTY
jgi:hypothetical protein